MQQEHWEVGPKPKVLEDRPYLANRRLMWQVEDGTMLVLFMHPADGCLALALSPEVRPRGEYRYRRDMVITGGDLVDLAMELSSSVQKVYGVPPKKTRNNSGNALTGALASRHQLGGSNIYLRSVGTKLGIIVDEGHEQASRQSLSHSARCLIANLSKDSRYSKVLAYLSANGKFF